MVGCTHPTEPLRWNDPSSLIFQTKFRQQTSCAVTHRPTTKATPNSPTASHPDRHGPGLWLALRDVRQTTLQLVQGLAPEDTVVQSMADVSPSKWHLAHTTWFFEQFVLGRDPSYRPLHPNWMVLFNSYYQSAGPMHARAARGLLSRPTLAEIIGYRQQVDERLAALLARGSVDAELAAILTLGLHHEQQHQELILTDIKHVFSINPLRPALLPPVLSRRPPQAPIGARVNRPQRWLDGSPGVVQIGHQGSGFAFDCETPRHAVLLHPHRVAARPVSNADYQQFIADGGYRDHRLWMAEGWDQVQRQAWLHPLYWSDDGQSEFSLRGDIDLQPDAPVCHVSFFEADAFARWAGARLPREEEWEHLAEPQAVQGNFQEQGHWHPQPATPDASSDSGAAGQWFGDVWEWTSSPYVNYPGFRPLPGALGEYNGKFMCGQWVLRGGSCVSPQSHLRASYRNFFYPADRWQFSGIRLAEDAA